MASIQLLNESIIFDSFMIYQFLKRLVTPFKKTKAYELGLIDENGKILKHRKDLTHAEKENFTVFDLLVWNLKKLLAKAPFGKTVLASYAAALFLIKEQKNTEILLNQDYLYEHFMDYYETILESPQDLHNLRMLMEEVPVNNVGGGNIAGCDGADGTVVVKKKPKVMKRKKIEPTKKL